MGLRRLGVAFWIGVNWDCSIFLGGGDDIVDVSFPVGLTKVIVCDILKTRNNEYEWNSESIYKDNFIQARNAKHSLLPPGHTIVKYHNAR